MLKKNKNLKENNLTKNIFRNFFQHFFSSQNRLKRLGALRQDEANCKSYGSSVYFQTKIHFLTST